MVKGWLKSAMDRDMRNSIRYANTARDIWVDLEERFGKGSAPRAFEIRRAVVLLRQEKASISSYYTKLKSLWDEMMAISPLPKCVCSGCTCNISKQMADMKEKEQLYDFLMGLDEEFTAVKSQILCSKPTPSLGRAYHMVSEDEQQRQVSATHKPMAEATAFQTQKVFNEKDGRGRRRDKPTCGHCQKIGHTEDQCYEIIGYPAHWRKGLRDKRGGQYIDQKATPKVAHVDADVNPLRSLTQAQMARLVQFLNTDEEKFKHGGASATPSVNMAGKIDKRNTWVIDSGATDHIVCDSNLLNRVELESGDFPVTIPNGDRVAVKSIGRYPNGQKGYRVYNPNDGTFSTTRDLSFIENIFPLKSSVHDLESRDERPHSRLEPMNDEHYDIQRIVQAQEANNGSTEHNQLEVENDCTTPIETSELVDIHATENHEPVEPPVPTHNVQQQHRSQRTRSMPKYLENYETTMPPSLRPTPSTHPSASSTRDCDVNNVLKSESVNFFISDP
nr:uncharacterized protein LOC109166102 [Ipomoea trifida]